MRFSAAFTYHTFNQDTIICLFFMKFPLQVSQIIAVYFESYLFTGRTFNSFYS